MPYLVIADGRILGANARYRLGLYDADKLGASLPCGTFIINVTGSLVIVLSLTFVSERGAISLL